MNQSNDNPLSGFIDFNLIPEFEPAPGCKLKTPYAEQLMLSRVEMEEDAVIPLHHHSHEQGGVLLSGSLELQIGDETRTLSPGEMYLIPSNTPHRAVAKGGPAVVLDVFSPIREDYVEMSNPNSTESNGDPKKSIFD